MDIASIGVATVTVVNPAPGGGTSNGLPFTIYRVCKRITVDPDGKTISPHDNQQFYAHAYDQFDQEITDTVFTWQTAGPQGAISAAGLFQVARSLGGQQVVYTITASAYGVSGVAHITIVLETTRWRRRRNLWCVRLSRSV